MGVYGVIFPRPTGEAVIDDDYIKSLIGIYGQVDTYAELPAASSHTGEIWFVRQSTGVYLINRKSSGFYYSSTTWKLAPDLVPFFSDANFKIYNDTDNTKALLIDASVISSGYERTLKMANRDIDLDHVFNYPAYTNEPTGFYNKDDSLISFVDGSMTFTIQPVSGSFDIFVTGKIIQILSAKSIIITADEGNHYIYFDENGTLQETTTFSIDIILKYVYVATVYWDSTNNKNIFFGEERHGLTMDGITHAHWHAAFGIAYISGLGLENIVADGDGNTNSHAQLSCANGKIEDEDIPHFIIDGSPQDLSPILQAPIFYKDTVSAYWRKDNATNYPVKRFGTGRLAYNQDNGGTWQQTEVSDDYYVLCFLFATNERNNPIVAVQGRYEYEKLTNAKTGCFTEVKDIMTEIFATEYVALGCVIYQTNSLYTNSVKARIIPFDDNNDYFDFRGYTRAELLNPRSNITTVLQQVIFNDKIVYGNSITPPNLTGNVSNYNPEGIEKANMIRLISNGNYSISGLQAPDPAVNQAIFIVNVGTNNITFKNNDGGSLAENRFLIGSNKTIQSNEGIQVVYDDVSLRWRSQAINI